MRPAYVQKMIDNNEVMGLLAMGLHDSAASASKLYQMALHNTEYEYEQAVRYNIECSEQGYFEEINLEEFRAERLAHFVTSAMTPQFDDGLPF